MCGRRAELNPGAGGSGGDLRARWKRLGWRLSLNLADSQRLSTPIDRFAENSTGPNSENADVTLWLESNPNVKFSHAGVPPGPNLGDGSASISLMCMIRALTHTLAKRTDRKRELRAPAAGTVETNGWRVTSLNAISNPSSSSCRGIQPEPCDPGWG